MSFKIALAAFSHPMIYDSSAERERFVQEETGKVGHYLSENGFEIINLLYREASHSGK